jgi:hypothetical protein
MSPPRVLSTLKIAEDGGISANLEVNSYSDGFAQLWDIAAPPLMIRPLPRHETVRMASDRVGRAVAVAMAKARERSR